MAIEVLHKPDPDGASYCLDSFSGSDDNPDDWGTLMACDYGVIGYEFASQVGEKYLRKTRWTVMPEDGSPRIQLLIHTKDWNNKDIRQSWKEFFDLDPVRRRECVDIVDENGEISNYVEEEWADSTMASRFELIADLECTALSDAILESIPESVHARMCDREFDSFFG